MPKRTMQTLVCPVCGKTRQYLASTQFKKYCSPKCYHIAIVGRTLSQEHKTRIHDGLIKIQSVLCSQRHNTAVSNAYLRPEVMLHHLESLKKRNITSDEEDAFVNTLRSTGVEIETQYIVVEARTLIDVAIVKEYLKLAIYVDGWSHNCKSHKVRDAKIDSVLRANNWTVLRFSTDQTVRDADTCVEAIFATLSDLTSGCCALERY